MSAEKKATLVFIPFPIPSHLVAAVKTAKLLTDRDERLRITVLIMKLPVISSKTSSFIQNSPDSRLTFVQLPAGNHPVLTGEQPLSQEAFFVRFIQSQRGPVRDALVELMERPGSGGLAGIVVDVFCTSMIDVARELDLASYVIFTSSSATLGLMLCLQSFRDEADRELVEYMDSSAAISVTTYVNPVPARVWPSPVFDKESGFLDIARKVREAKGVIINSFLELERHAITSLSGDDRAPPVYPIGPILHDQGEKTDQDANETLQWLDKQPDSSVVFLCFGSIGCFRPDQVKEIAAALESSGFGFLWSLRKPPPEEKMDFPGDYENPEEVLPEGFLQRTAGTGKVIGWAPQMAVLSHPAVGGFVSHCGWNSTLESIWCGVPMAAWPLAAEQQANAFQLVKEFGMAVEIKMDYRKNCGVLVASGEIEKSVRKVMDMENEIRVKVKEMKGKSREALMEGGSSYNYLGSLINNFMENVS